MHTTHKRFNKKIHCYFGFVIILHILIVSKIQQQRQVFVGRFNLLVWPILIITHFDLFHNSQSAPPLNTTHWLVYRICSFINWVIGHNLLSKLTHLTWNGLNVLGTNWRYLVSTFFFWRALRSKLILNRPVETTIG